MMRMDTPAPAIVQPAEDADELAAAINAEHEAGQEHARRSLEHYRRGGELLLQAKAKCKHGDWLKWLAANVRFDRTLAWRYMEMAKCCRRATFEEEWQDWRRICGNETAADAPADTESEPSPDVVAPAETDQPFFIDAAGEGADVPLSCDTATRATGDADEDQPVPHVARNSGEQEWYSPPEYLDAVRAVLGTIDLDPASCDLAQERVQATSYYTKEEDGLAQRWAGNVFMNPPYAAELVGQFVEKLCGHFAAADVPEAIALVNNASDTAWFGQLFGHAAAWCFVRGRIRFLRPDGTSGNPLQGQAVCYLGPNPERFADVFDKFGYVLFPRSRRPSWATWGSEAGFPAAPQLCTADKSVE
jgi:ParB family chromosome partitioning protein